MDELSVDKQADNNNDGGVAEERRSILPRVSMIR
jgi:hypothetical protein